jgi:S-adenosylmethionine/arginine decarboxylase-like enzyme
VKFNGEKANEIIHHHLIYQAKVDRKDLNEKSSIQLVQFLDDLVSVIDMQILIPPQVAFSDHKAWTGLVGIVTSHISFHFWTIEKYLQLDIYSCKKFNISKTVTFLDNFWKSEKKNVLFIERAVECDFKLTKY